MKDQEYFDTRIARYRKLHPNEAELPPPVKLPTGPKKGGQAAKKKTSKTTQRTVRRLGSESEDLGGEEDDEGREQVEDAPVGRDSVEGEEDRAEMERMVEQPKTEATSAGGIFVPIKGSKDNEETITMGVTGDSKVSEDVAKESLKNDRKSGGELVPNLVDSSASHVLEGQSYTRMNDGNLPDEHIGATSERLDTNLTHLVLQLTSLRQSARS
jgi:hypothetical protein